MAVAGATVAPATSASKFTPRTGRQKMREPVTESPRYSGQKGAPCDQGVPIRRNDASMSALSGLRGMRPYTYLSVAK